jgi:hypothetical protein
MKFGFVKCFVFLALFAVSFSASKTNAQARPSPATQVISINFIPALIDFPMSIQYEFKADPTDSWLLRLNYWPGLSSQWTGFGFGAAYRFYIADSRALTGLAVAPAADLYLFKQSQLSGGSGTRSAIAVAIGGDLTYKWIFDEFAVEPIVGVRYGIGGTSVPPDVATIFPIIGVSVGYAW